MVKGLWQARLTRLRYGWQRSRRGRSLLLGLVAGCILLTLTGCDLPQVSAEERLFLPLQIELLDVATLPPQTFADTPVGGLSALTYDRQQDVFYALSDDRGRLAPPRFYTLKIATDVSAPEAPTIGSIEVQAVTTLKDQAGNDYPSDRLDPEGMVLSPRQTVFISSEGVPATQAPPALNEYDLATGRLQTEFRLPARFLPAVATEADPEPEARGIRENLGFEALTLGPTSSAGAFEPFRLFMATESALAQDFDPDPANPLANRFVHYLIGPDQSTFISEYAYPLSLEPLGTVVNGLTELVAIDQGGHFLALERVLGIRGFIVKLFQLATGGATDISTVPALPTLDNLNPIQKQLLLDFTTLDLPVDAIDNLEGMTLGPPLPDGSASLWLISDNNFSQDQTTQVWLFRLAIG
ncbi:esterase-like activity of phytase family protein [Halomicronema sp. CCY15110]|uniref:esterase-like activity of phytase family protein n=1 Tax=Halomicronema sp. CCY15110 TaxID=2767773 RepID=UPI00281687E4|nr:esterase-like activity of phytase family protein [Halomicronema sp. CCY15110]